MNEADGVMMACEIGANPGQVNIEMIFNIYANNGPDSCEIFGDSYMFLLPGNTMGYSINSGRIAAHSAIEYMKQR